ncbi:hypothetical protein A8C32_03550 [Flavivirga aquatica]|uniref:CoF synthetase n=1 Tax=Flavivirga aquatica TaxID=1849968 RepID=A0A1E5TB10_9FLAO|nr:hypothetical protein [Flavivirga aquatica]OEK08541.1 hypothetical protein A8C32_03550 [Flavivirga aquatica]
MKLLTYTLENLRNNSYWFLDFIKNSPIKKHTNDISFILENFSNKKSEDLRKNKLEKIVNHARETTPFYKEYKKFEDLPIVNKNTIRNSREAFQSNAFNKEQLRTVSTSGSTSIALEIDQNPNKIKRNTADSIYFGKLAGFRIGYKLLYLRNWDKHLKKSSVTKFLQNIDEFEVVDINDKYIKQIIDSIKNDASRKGWLGYPSAYELVCKYLDKTNAKPINCNIKSIITMSEGVNKYTKESMSKYFKAPLVSRYSNMENGIIAQQAINQDYYIINWASYYVEIFDLNDDTPAELGEPGRIIVTDLYNYANPFLRYDTGDIGMIDYSVTPPILKHVEGRKTDVIFNTKGDIVSSFIITNIVDYKGVIQGQLIQEKQKEYTIKLNTTKEFNQEKEVLSEFTGYLGSDAIIQIDYVKEIPLLTSGKRKATVNNYSVSQ